MVQDERLGAKGGLEFIRALQRVEEAINHMLHPGSRDLRLVGYNAIRRIIVSSVLKRLKRLNDVLSRNRVAGVDELVPLCTSRFVAVVHLRRPVNCSTNAEVSRQGLLSDSLIGIKPRRPLLPGAAVSLSAQHLEVLRRTQVRGHAL